MHKTDLAYAAGIIDGEGNIEIAKHSGVNYWGCAFNLRIRVSTVDSIITPWLASVFGSHSYVSARRTRYNHADCHWFVCGDKAMKFLEEILPYLKLKKAQALVAIQFQKQKIKSKHRGRIKHLSRKFFESEQQFYWVLRNLKMKYKPIYLES